MKTAGLWMHAWDVWSDGLETVLGYARDAGLTTLYPASNYHAGWFIHPHSRGRRCWLPEDGALYFQPAPDLWEDCRLRPPIARCCHEVDQLAALRDAVGSYGLTLSTWTICCHNTALGLAHPEVCVQNCFGDRYPHALNPAHPDVRQYLEVLVRNLALSYRPRAIQLESPGYLGFRHGHHHERYSVVLDAVAGRLFDLSFAEHDLAMARAAGINAGKLRDQVAALLQGYFDSAPDRPAEWPGSWDELLERLPALRQYQNAQTTLEEGVKDLCRAALAGGTTLLEGFEGGSQYQIVTCSGYGLNAAQVHQRVSARRQQLEAGQELQVGLRPGFGDVPSAAALREIVAACDEAGADGVIFYNYSEMSRANLSWIGPALRDHMV
ncbi:MAG: hypothetical protein IT204_10600 [Fimbriimonadaceae bacterium]|nr:hypothetical protein [Fimbriimonadaceae bacterium]